MLASNAHHLSRDSRISPSAQTVPFYPPKVWVGESATGRILKMGHSEDEDAQTSMNYRRITGGHFVIHAKALFKCYIQCVAKRAAASASRAPKRRSRGDSRACSELPPATPVSLNWSRLRCQIKHQRVKKPYPGMKIFIALRTLSFM
ncbi:Hypothetical predicted protein [Podarcis lilfordi]|uniref:Uncharacterized protein n=1 Tax=Podarcis lilfordi TaxID=74358 RepID=A0AA35K3P8_9SAUR|nr:Hypothetical predicted protein [Podarcis lilfordi]